MRKINIKSLEDIINIQLENGNWNYDPYMMGLANGLLMAEHIIKGRDGEVNFNNR